MKIDNSLNSVKLSGTEPKNEVVKAEKFPEEKKTNFFAGNLSFGQSKVDMEREKAKKATQELIDKVWKNDASMDADAETRTENVKKLKEENLENARMMGDIQDEIVALENLPEEEQTPETQKKLAELKEGLKGYQEADFLNKKEIYAENAAVRGMRLERLKHHDMIDANKQGEQITDAVEKNVIGICMEEAKEKQDNDLQEMKEFAAEKKAEEELLEAKISAARERREEASSEEKDDMEEMYELNNTLDVMKQEKQNENLPDMKKSMEQVVSEMKIAAEDLKGLIVDSDV